MPVQYTSIMEEHNAVRTRAGIFDTSHMGTFVLNGPSAGEFLQQITTAPVRAMEPGRARYGLLLNERGGVIDDLIIYRREYDFVIVVNAGNREKDFTWMSEHALPRMELKDISATVCMLALQGPDAQKIMQPFVKNDLSSIRYFRSVAPHFVKMTPAFAMLARTGYTGEDGFEIIVSQRFGAEVWNELVKAGALPCGLGCRDTLRLEACMPLHGHEITEDITPMEAELDRCVSWTQDFVGRDALLKQKEDGPRRFLTAFSMSAGIPRAHCEILVGAKQAGMVTSGTYSPTFKKGIGMGYVDRRAQPGQEIQIVVHNQPRPAAVVPMPFYKRAGK